MPNYLAGDIAPEGLKVEKDGTLRIISDISEIPEASTGEPPEGFQVTKSGEYKIEDDKSNFENLSTKASVSNDFSGLQQVSGFGGGLQGPGSKPAALHTEYAGEGSGGPAYGTQDLVFYLQRCGEPDSESLGDTGDGGDGGSSSLGDDTPRDPNAEIDQIPANGRSGPVPENGELQSGLNQIAMGRMGLGAVKGGPMAPFSGFTFEGSAALGEITQNAPRFSDIDLNLVNAVKRVKELSEFVQSVGLGSSEKLFAGILNKNFNPDLPTTGIRSEDDILNTLSRPMTSELAFMLAREVRGRIRNKDIIRAINDGKLGRVTERSKNFQARMGNPGRAPK